MSGYYRDFFWPAASAMLKLILTSATTFALLTVSTTSLADTPEPPLFVAPGGASTGDCKAASEPCTLDHALRRVGKHGQLRVAPGDYTLSNPEDVFYLISNAIDVQAEAGATLTGVAHEFAGALGARGFHVIADTKGQNRETIEKLAATHQSVQSTVAATRCIGGFAGAFPCDNVDLLARVNDRALSASGADIWGFVDLNSNREYAIMGYSSGTAVYDLSDPENPREIGFIDGQPTTWRDIKVYQFWNSNEQRFNAYAYVTADRASDGLVIIDLTRLPQRISRVNNNSDFFEAHNVYLSRADFGTGLALTNDTPVLIIAGSERGDGRFRTYSLNNPEAPSFIATPATPGGQPGNDRLYMHDGASMLVTDARKDTQCVNAAAYCDVVFDFNEGTLDIWDVTDPADPQRLSRTPYTNNEYSHSGWWSEDKQYVFLQDEIDEQNRGLFTTLRVFWLADLRNPTLVATWNGPTRAIDHNGFVRGNRYYMSNYHRGLTILDITNPIAPTGVGQFDSFPSSDSTGFGGAWGAYPFLPSGNILISDIDTGLYVLDDLTHAVAEGSFSFGAESFAAGESGSASISVQRAGGDAGAVSVEWEIFGASGSATDASVLAGTVNWADGDTTDKSITVPIPDEGINERLERLIVKLHTPTGGATLSAPNLASLYVNDPGASPTVGFSDAGIAVPERGFSTAVVVVERGGLAQGALSVDYAVSGGDAGAGTDYMGPASGTIAWTDGDADPKVIEYEVVDDGSSESKEFFELTLSNPSAGQLAANTILRVSILDGTGASSAPNAVAGANQTVSSGANVTLTGASSNDPDGDTLEYEWIQIAGPAVTLSNSDQPNASFDAPTVTSDTLLRFSLQVMDTTGLIDTSTVGVTVRSNAAAAPPSSSGGGTLSLWMLALLLFERMRFYNRLFAIRPR